MTENILEELEQKIDRAVTTIATLKSRVNRLEENKKELEAELAERELRIEGLQKRLEELSERPDDYEVQRYKANEQLLKQRIRALLSKLDDLKVLD